MVPNNNNYNTISVVESFKTKWLNEIYLDIDRTLRPLINISSKLQNSPNSKHTAFLNRQYTYKPLHKNVTLNLFAVTILKHKNFA